MLSGTFDAYATLGARWLLRMDVYAHDGFR